MQLQAQKDKIRVALHHFQAAMSTYLDHADKHADVGKYNIYLVLGPLCKPLLVMELPNKRLLLLNPFFSLNKTHELACWV